MIGFKNLFLLSVAAAATLLLGTEMVAAQEACRATGSSQYEITIRNELKFDIEIKWLKPDCSEDEGLTVGAGREIKVTGFDGQTYRIYENWTTRILTEVVFKNGQLLFPISGFEESKRDPLKKLCSRKGDPRFMNVRNATENLVVVKFVSPDCDEKGGPIIAPGKQVSANTFVNNVFRAYDQESGKLVAQFPIRPTQRNYVIGGSRDPVPSISFLKTVNTFRSFSKIEHLELDDTLTATCQWFAEFMATEDKQKAGHLVSDFTKSQKFGKYNTPKQRLINFG